MLPTLTKPLTKRQERVLFLLLSGFDVPRIARALKVCQRSVYRLLNRALRANSLQNTEQLCVAWHLCTKIEPQKPQKAAPECASL